MCHKVHRWVRSQVGVKYEQLIGSAECDMEKKINSVHHTSDKYLFGLPW